MKDGDTLDKYVVIDLETTGQTVKNNDKIIEIGMVMIEDGCISDTFSELFHPGRDIPPFISHLTGITNKSIENKPAFKEKADEIKSMLRDSYIIAHNVPFDAGFLNQEFLACGYSELNNAVLDTVELARIFYPQAPSYKLERLSDYLNIQHDDPHRALSDARVTAEIFLNIMQKIKQLPYETITHLRNLERTFTSDLAAILKKEQETLAFTTAEPEEIEVMGGLAFRKAPEDNQNTTPIDTSFGAYLDDIYEQNGTMQQQMDTFETRDGQREMSEHIYDSFTAKKHALIEAETGTGKSLAYLIPAVYEALKSQKRIVISTYTTQLQSQLLEEEIPLTESLISHPFKVALLKGKRHYISLEKFAHELHFSNDNNYDFILTKAMLLVWITETTTGDIDEIRLPSGGYTFFRRISTEAENNINPTSPWFMKSYFQRAKKKAQQANIIITNHALLCADLFNEYQFIPPYTKAIIDEAHHLEGTASKHYGLKIHDSNLRFTLNQIGLLNERNGIGNLVHTNRMTPENDGIDNWDDEFTQTKHEIDDLFQALFQYVLNQETTQKSQSDIGRIQYRFEHVSEDDKNWETITDIATRLTFLLRDLIHILATIKKTIEDADTANKHDSDQIRGYMEELQKYMDDIEALFLVQNDPTIVKWIEIETSNMKQSVYLYLEPTDIAAYLKEDFFKQKDCIVLTSATLTMRESFSFIRKRLGIPEEEVWTHKIASPFSYDDQVQLMVPNDFPVVNKDNMDDYIHATCEAILSLAAITKGRMLVLFTSYDMLKKSYRLLQEMFDEEKYVLIAQGISSGSRLRLKKNFQTFDEAILLGTSSFWEGVDIPGEDLSSVVIARLPFEPPNHPVYEARSTLMKENGQNPFFELALPNAVIRFKQGFGRLIRSSSDRGIVFVCDARIVKARYGKFFTESIPNVHLEMESTNKLMSKAEKWF